MREVELTRTAYAGPDTYIQLNQTATGGSQSTISGTFIKNNSEANYSSSNSYLFQVFNGNELLREETCTGTETGAMEFIL